MKALKKSATRKTGPKTLAKKLASVPMKPKSTAHLFEAERHLRKFCSITSRELGNVLGAIVGELDYALSHPEPTVRDRAMHVALSAAERALTLSRNLQYFAVLTRLDSQLSDLSQILLNTVDLMEKEFEVKNIKLIVFAEASTYAHVDGRAIQQVIFNLLSNASHAMPKGGKVTVTLRQLAKGIEVSCTDTGPTLPPESAERVFEPYFSDGVRNTSEAQGLQLAVAKALVEAHGGEIHAESRPGENTSFTFRLPNDPTAPKPNRYSEKRRHRRVEVSLPAELIIKGQATIRTEVTLLSVGGCFVRLPDPNALRMPEPNGTVMLRIYYYNDEMLEVYKARVANVCRAGADAGLGVEFHEVDAKGRKVLSAIVKSHSS